ncbi:MAG TPA: DUF2252 domain-containing protein [Solirubrobacterales bacterium]|nr:DUF2252 domain-containing protein [Solirubrobacterales bacterium]
MSASAVLVADGKGRRRKVPRSRHGEWEPPAGRDPLAILAAQAKDRVPELVPIRYGRMLTSAFAFYRGGAAVMAADLAADPDTGLRAQLCGDAHLSNFGVFAAPDRRLVFDCNDFDETCPGPFEWDVKRLAASIAIAGRERGFSRGERRRALEATALAYREAMREFAEMGNVDVWYARVDVESMQGRVKDALSAARRREMERKLDKARGKDSLRALRKLTTTDGDGRLRIASAPPLLTPLSELADADEGERALRPILDSYTATLSDDRHRLIDSYTYVDAARKVVGVGSVGTRAWIVLMMGRDGEDPLFLQAKEAGPSVLEPYAGPSEYSNHGRRVVEGQRLMQAASDIFLGWVEAEGLDARSRCFYVRQLWDGKGSVDVERISAEELGLYGALCARTLARAHARSGDRVAIAAYLGGGDVFDRAIGEFAERYADQNERDYAALLEAEKRGEVEVERGL